MPPILNRLAVVALVAAPAPAFAAPSIRDVVTPDNLGAEVKWLESQIGPAFRIEGELRIYKLGACELGVHESGGKIEGFEAAVSDACTFDLTPFMTNSPPPALGALTFGAFDQATGGHVVTYQADCLKLCGNAADPVLYGTWEGARADGMISVVLGVRQVEDAALDAGFAWEKEMEAVEGEDYVIDTRFNCDGKYNDNARKLMADVKPDWIAVGHVSAPGISCATP